MLSLELLDFETALCAFASFRPRVGRASIGFKVPTRVIKKIRPLDRPIDRRTDRPTDSPTDRLIDCLTSLGRLGRPLLDLLLDALGHPLWDPLPGTPSKVTHFLLTASHRSATFRPDPARHPFETLVGPGRRAPKVLVAPAPLTILTTHPVEPQWR